MCAYCVAQVVLVLGFVAILQLLVEGAPPALGAISLEALLDPHPGALEPEALLVLLCYFLLEFVALEYLGDVLIDPTTDLLPVPRLAPLLEDIVGWDDLAP